MEQSSEDLHSAIASYLPDRQIITFSKEMLVFSGNMPNGKFQDPQEVSYFFHEWLHYLHNVSTIHGISAFSSLIGLWNAFRFTTDKLGFGHGEFNGTSTEILKTQTYTKILSTTRRPTGSPSTGSTLVERFRIVACSPTGDVDGVPDQLDLIVEESNEAGDNVRYQKMFGPTEILESVAYLLESRLLVDAFGQDQSLAPAFPYHALTLLARNVAPSLSEREILLCGLTSLQSTFPVDAVFQLLNVCDRLKGSGEDVNTVLERFSIQNLQEHAAKVRAGLDEISAMFPSDTGIAQAVKSTASYMRANLDVRLTKPFFELELIEDIRMAGPGGFHKLMDRFLEKYGICSCRQEQDGLATDIGRDILFNFAIVSKDDKLNESRLILLASFDHLIGHLMRDGTFQHTEAVKRRCPFYTSCIESTRQDHPDDCGNRPWRAVITRPDDLCTYAAGVRDLGAPEDIRDRPLLAPDA